MNFTLDKKKCIYIVIWLLIGLLSFTVLGKYASAPESHQATIASLDEKKATVLELTAATTATSALITLLPGDIGTPIAEKVADLSGYLLIVLCAVFLEKYLVTINGYAAFKIFIPAACVLYAANMMARNRSVDKLARRLLIFGICIFLVVPASVKVSDLIETTYQSQIDATLEDAKSTQEMLENSSAAQQEMEQAQQFGVWKAARAEDGLKYIIAGLGMKVLLADRLGFLWNDIQTIGFESISTPLAWLGAAAYSMELYFDFAGYSLIAVGIGRMIGLPAIKNFDQPYSSRSVSEFYRRWHMTLGSWFRDYLYIPLGGNRKGTLRTVFNLLLVWAVTGFWHGGGLHFILWGMILGLLVVIEKLWIGKWLKKSKILSHAYVLFVIPLTWMVFAIPTLPEIGVYFARLFPFFGVGSAVNPGDFAKELTLFIPELVGGILLCIPQVYRWCEKHRKNVIVVAALFVVFWYSVYRMANAANNPFMYANF